MNLDPVEAARRMRRGEGLGLGMCPQAVILGLLDEIERLERERDQAAIGVRCDVCGAGPTENCKPEAHGEDCVVCDDAGGP